MDLGVFERYEIKYRVSRRQREALLETLWARMDEDAFGAHTVLSLYYDTPDFRLIRRSLEKPAYKEKLRLRCYGVPDAGSRIYVEMKNKVNGVVYKRRTGMALAEAAHFLAGEEAPQTQIGREIAAFLARYPGIRPAALICCEREAYFGRGEEKGLRVTFDCDIRCRMDALDPTLGAGGTPLMGRRECLMEVKLPPPGGMPLWLAHTLDAQGIYPASFSKYGAAYGARFAARAEERTKEVDRCA